VRTELDAIPVERILRAAAIDTVVHTGLLTDHSGPRRGTVDLDGTRSLLAAAARAGLSKLVVKSSADYYGADRQDPAFFTEEMPAAARPRTPTERGVIRAERALAAFAAHRPRTTVTVLRCAHPISSGPALRTAHLSALGMPVVPGILGFDPRWQFVHEDDVVGGLLHAVTHELPGPYNLAGDGVLSLSEVAGLLGKPFLPVLPPWGTLFAADQMRRTGLEVPSGLIRDLRYGRGLDNRRLKASGYALRYTSREAILKLRADQRLRPLLGRGGEAYRYDPEVEDFLRRSPSVRSQRAAREAGPAGAAPPGGPSRKAGPPGAGGYSDLSQTELLEIIPSLETEAMLALREHEAMTAARAGVLDEIDHQLALRSSFPAE
jgi:UDP-glucose 4-epimerase